MEEGLAMHQLHFQAEIRQFNDLGVEAAKVSDAEMKLAEQLVDHLKTTRFDPNDTWMNTGNVWKLQSRRRSKVTRLPFLLRRPRRQLLQET
jgi:hypothetical protein